MGRTIYKPLRVYDKRKGKEVRNVRLNGITVRYRLSEMIGSEWVSDFGVPILYIPKSI
jgi:hypothetical protein